VDRVVLFIVILSEGIVVRDSLAEWPDQDRIQSERPPIARFLRPEDCNLSGGNRHIIMNQPGLDGVQVNNAGLPSSSVHHDVINLWIAVH